jgi:outer membrane biogenesis lipoprotein LolB
MALESKPMERVVGILVGLGILMLTACSSHDPKPVAQPTPDQVRGHADRGFDKLKQEEQERGVQTNVPR